MVPGKALDKNSYHGNCASCKTNRILHGSTKKESYFLRQHFMSKHSK